MLETMITWLGENEGPMAYGALGLSAGLEYVFPPFPGDVLALTGVALALSAGFDVSWVFVSLTLGSVVGAALVYRFGVRLGPDSTGWPRFLRGPRVEPLIERSLKGFQRWGTPLLATNRFFPVLRSVLLLSAGMLRLPQHRVLFYATLSALAWNALILGAGYWVGGNFEALAGLFEKYTIVATTIVVGIAVIMLYRARKKTA